MTDNGEYYKTEKTIGDAFREDATRTAPPFAGIAERIAAGEPCESFGEFFAGEVIPVRQTASQKGGFWSTNRKTIAAAAASKVSEENVSDSDLSDSDSSQTDSSD